MPDPTATGSRREIAEGEQRCWSCTEPVEWGYRVDIYLVGSQPEAVQAMSAPLCYRCFGGMNQAFGEMGKRGLRRAAAEQSRRRSDE